MRWIAFIVAASALLAGCSKKEEPPPKTDWVGSASCKECHQDFYRKWSTSFHGLAMQPFTPKLAATLPAQTNDVVVGPSHYRALLDRQPPVVVERTANGEKSYPILHALGGKNVFYFLTQLEKGWFQTLPVAFDVHRQEWYDTAASAMRHFSGVTN